MRAGRARPVVAAGADLAWLTGFVLLGRSSHTEGQSITGVARTLWPFLAGLVLGWIVARAWRQPARVVPVGVVVWSVSVAVAMILRAVSGQGVAPAFVGVAFTFVGLGLLGWRGVAGLAQRHRTAGPAPG